MAKKNSYSYWPDEKGYFGQYGGRYVAETLMPLILDVEKNYNKIKNNETFKKNLDYYLKAYVGRPSPLFFAERIPKGEFSITKQFFLSIFDSFKAVKYCSGDGLPFVQSSPVIMFSNKLIKFLGKVLNTRLLEPEVTIYKRIFFFNKNLIKLFTFG